MKITFRKLTALVLALILAINCLPLVGAETVESAEYETILCDEERLVEISEFNGYKQFAFTPPEDGIYLFSSFENNSNDTYGYVLDSAMNVVSENDDDGGELNFKVQCELKAENTYYLKAEFLQENATGSFYVKVIKAISATSIQINWDSALAFYTGNVEYVSVNFYPENSATEDFTLSSDNESVLTVNGRHIEGVSAGVANLAATTESGLTATVSVTVLGRPDATAIDIGSGDNVIICEGKETGLWINYTPYNSKPQEVLWHSDNETVATVDENGCVKGIAQGSANITATTDGGLTDTCTVDVIVPAALTTNEPLNVSLPCGKSTYLKFIPSESAAYRISGVGNSQYAHCNFRLMDAEMNSLDYSYEYNGNRVIEYDFIAGEEYYINIHDSNIGLDFNIDYIFSAIKLSVATAIKIPYSSISGDVGVQKKLQLQFLPEPSKTEAVIWSSSDSSIAYVDSENTLHFQNAGTAVITATTEDGLTDSVEVTVTAAEQIAANETKSLTITPDCVGRVITFTPENSGVYQYDVRTSHNTTLELLDQSGMSINTMSGESGFASQNTFEGGQTYRFIIFPNETINSSFDFSLTVKEMAAATGIEISGNIQNGVFTGYVGSIEYLGYNFLPYGSMGEQVFWSSSNPEIVSISENHGEIRLLSEGTATVTVTSISGFSDSVTVVVKGTDAINLNQAENIEFTASNENKRYRFTPAETGAYYFDFGGEFAERGGWGFNLSNNNGEHLHGGSNNTTRVLNAGQEYYITVYNHGENYGMLLLTVSKGMEVAALELLSPPAKMDYYEFENSFNIDGMKLRVTFVDGTVADNVRPYDLLPFGYSIDVKHSYTTGEWGSMSEYVSTTVSCGAQSVGLTFNILENPVKRVELNQAPTREYIFGDNEYGSYVSSPEGTAYSFYPRDLTGLEFTVYYKDGTSRVFTDADINYDEQTINGFNYNINFGGYYIEPCSIPMFINYMGNMLDYTIELVASSVASIEVVNAPDITEYENGFVPDFIGMQILITYTNGTTKTVTVSKENISYSAMDTSYGFWAKINVDGYNLIIEPLAVGEDNMLNCSLSYLGAGCQYSGIKIVQGREVVNVEVENPSESFDGMLVKLTYADQTSEVLRFETLDKLNMGGGEQYYQGIALVNTQKGMYSFNYEITHNANNEPVMYSFFNLFSHSIGIDPRVHNYEMTIVIPTYTEIGKRIYTCSKCGDSYTETYGFAYCDVDCDGDIDAGDFAIYMAQDEGKKAMFDFDLDGKATDFDSLVFKRLANGFDMQTVADANGDGKTDLKDLLRIKLLLAGGQSTIQADLDGSGTVDAADLIFIKKAILTF